MYEVVVLFLTTSTQKARNRCKKSHGAMPCSKGCSIWILYIPFIWLAGHPFQESMVVFDSAFCDLTVALVLSPRLEASSSFHCMQLLCASFKSLFGLIVMVAYTHATGYAVQSVVGVNGNQPSRSTLNSINCRWLWIAIKAFYRFCREPPYRCLVLVEKCVSADRKALMKQREGFNMN